MNNAKVIKNITAGTLIIHDVARDADGVGNVSLTMVANEIVDLSLRFDLDETAHSKGLDAAIAAAQIQVLETVASITSIISWVLATDVSLQFTGGIDGLNGPTPSVNNYAGPKEGVTVPLVVVNGSGVIDTLNSLSTVVLTATGGTSPKINGMASPQTVTLVNGTVSAVISDTAAGVVNLAMSAPTHPTVVLATDTAVITLS